MRNTKVVNVTHDNEVKQRILFNQLAEKMEMHDDKHNQSYRTKFIYSPLFRGINLKNKNVLEAMCSSGSTTSFLLSKGAVVTGLDISENSIKRFKKRWPKCKAVCKSILNTGFKDNTFDVVVIIMGLHHIHPHVQEAILEAYRIIRPKGYFCFVEPHSGSIVDIFRRAWYFVDRMFETNESSIDLKELKNKNKSRFTFLKGEYGGGLGYYFVFNSIVFRIPIKIKKYYSPFLINFDKVTKPLLTKLTAGYTLCVWQKNI